MPKVLLPFFLFVVLLAHNRVSAQYSIRGVVEDKAGQPYVGAHVKLVPGSYSTTTNDQGEFELSNLKSGEYLLSISYLGTKGYVEKTGINSG